jgi:hypothetical protein
MLSIYLIEIPIYEVVNVYVIYEVISFLKDKKVSTPLDFFHPYCFHPPSFRERVHAPKVPSSSCSKHVPHSTLFMPNLEIITIKLYFHPPSFRERVHAPKVPSSCSKHVPHSPLFMPNFEIITIKF